MILKLSVDMYNRVLFSKKLFKCDQGKGNGVLSLLLVFVRERRGEGMVGFESKWMVDSSCAALLLTFIERERAFEMSGDEETW